MQVRLLRGMAIGASAVLGLAVLGSSVQAQAQTSGTRFGVEAAFGANNNIGIGVGAFVKFHLAEISEHPITGRVSFDYFFPSSSYYGGYSFHYFQIAADGLLDITTAKGSTKPYVGAGLEYVHESYGSGYDCTFYACGSSSVGLDLVGGLNFMADKKLMPFVEIKLGVGGGSEFVIKGGIHF